MLAKKRFGQNFLEDQHVIQKIIQALHLKATDHLIEIGPGRAALTEHLSIVACLDVIEIDRDLIPGLRALATQQHNLTVHATDALAFDYASLKTDKQALRIIGNLPYNISTPLIFHLLNYRDCIQDMHFMLQKEVVDRICAQAGDSNYGRLSVMTQYYCEVNSLFTVPASAFNPKPKVESAIIRLIPKATSALDAKNHDNLLKIVTTAFSKRRKTLRNSLNGLMTEARLLALDIDPQARPETLSLKDFVKIANTLD